MVKKAVLVKFEEADLLRVKDAAKQLDQRTAAFIRKASKDRASKVLTQ